MKKDEARSDAVEGEHVQRIDEEDLFHDDWFDRYVKEDLSEPFMASQKSYLVPFNEHHTAAEASILPHPKRPKLE